MAKKKWTVTVIGSYDPRVCLTRTVEAEYVEDALKQVDMPGLRANGWGLTPVEVHVIPHREHSDCGDK